MQTLTVEARLERLERSVRRYRVAMILLLCGVLSAGVMGFSKDGVQDVVKARLIQLIGPKGTALAEIGTADGAGGIIRLFSGKGGGGVVNIHAWPDEAALLMGSGDTHLHMSSERKEVSIAMTGKFSSSLYRGLDNIRLGIGDSARVAITRDDSVMWAAP